MENSNFCAGIVTYNPDIVLLENVISAVSVQVQRVFIFDNNSANVADLLILCNKYSCEFETSKKNMGIAYALNRLCEHALKNGYSWILTLDHDTIVSDNMIESFRTLTRINDVGIICPRVNYVGFAIKDKYDTNLRYVNVPACMTSGSLMNLHAWDKTDHFNEWLFIDSVDNDICYQLKTVGYKIIRDNNTFMEHNLGHPRYKKLLFFKYADFQYSPIRLYYIVRNRIYLTKRYWRQEGFRFVLATFKIIISNIIIYIQDAPRREMIFKGIKDGIKTFLKE